MEYVLLIVVIGIFPNLVFHVTDPAVSSVLNGVNQLALGK